MYRLLIIFCLTLGGMHAAQAALFGDEEAHKKISELKQQLDQLELKLADESQQRLALDQRIVPMENQLNSQGMIEMLNQIERLNGEIAKLKGQIEVMAHDVEVTKKRQSDLYVDLDNRLRRLEDTAAPTSETSRQSETGEVESETSATTDQNTEVKEDSATELQDYEAAYATFKDDKYSEAAAAFEKFLATYPNSKLAPNAQYWIGYSHFAMKNYNVSIAVQQKLLESHPDHQKAPDAMYNIANSQVQLSNIDEAKQTLKKLLAKYPSSDVAPLAKRRLAIIELAKSKN